MDHGKMIEKHAKAAGLGDVKVSWFKFTGGNPMNDGLISGNLDIASTGTPAFFTLWAKVRNTLDVRGIAAYSTLPLTLVTLNPKVQSIKDFTEADRIAVPMVKVSTQAIILQMAAEATFVPASMARSIISPSRVRIPTRWRNWCPIAAISPSTSPRRPIPTSS